jgi:hypothetical protein
MKNGSRGLQFQTFKDLLLHAVFALCLCDPDHSFSQNRIVFFITMKCLKYDMKFVKQLLRQIDFFVQYRATRSPKMFTSHIHFSSTIRRIRFHWVTLTFHSIMINNEVLHYLKSSFYK